MIIPVPECEPDDLTEFLGSKFSRNETGYHSSWANCTFTVARMFLSQGFATEIRFRRPVLLKVCHQVCCVRFIPRTPSKDEKMEDVFFPFIDDEMMADPNWKFVLIFKDDGNYTHKWSMFGWASREDVVQSWEQYEIKVKHHGYFSHKGVRSRGGELRKPDDFYTELLFPEAFPFVWSRVEATAQDQAEEEKRIREIENTQAPATIDWGI